MCSECFDCGVCLHISKSETNKTIGLIKEDYRTCCSIHRLHTSGILHYLRTKWTSNTPAVSEEESVPSTTVTLRHVQLILSLYAASIAYSLLLLMIERAWFRRHNQHVHQATVSRKYETLPIMKT
ncbi:hypothetical protein L798_14431 [Zootermopsis nevadensis]|uniref:Uncharacterized protein n=1 Tax=Zootermopsis nevadensis TaxID=136037 RepID=A0A067R0F5_ZOONE|nr:hypothetical protein L798_14431 [Zootermopsis nevadensis]